MVEKLCSIRFALISGTVLLLVISAGFLVRRADTAEEVAVLSSTEAMTSPGQQPSGRYQDHRQILRVWFHGDSFYPDVLRARPGLVLIRAENQTQSDITLVIERVIPGQAQRQELTRINALRKVRRAMQELVLGVGEYVFYEQSQPEIQGKLIVEPN